MLRIVVEKSVRREEQNYFKDTTGLESLHLPVYSFDGWHSNQVSSGSGGKVSELFGPEMRIVYSLSVPMLRGLLCLIFTVSSTLPYTSSSYGTSLGGFVSSTFVNTRLTAFTQTLDSQVDHLASLVSHSLRYLGYPWSAYENIVIGGR